MHIQGEIQLALLQKSILTKALGILEALLGEKSWLGYFIFENWMLRRQRYAACCW